jgi:hypothetical protein
MPKPRITGTLQPVRQPVKVSYDPQRGLQIIIPWESAGNNLQGLATTYQANRVAYELEATDRKSTLVATASGGQLGIPDLTTDTWQILGNEIQKSLLEHPDVVAGIDTATRDEIENATLNGTKEADLNPALSAFASKVFDRLRRGNTHYALGQYVLRHTTNVSNVYAQNVADFNIERIYTTSQLIAEVTNANSWIFPMPGRMVNKLQGISAPTTKTGYLWGWRKLPSTETTTAGNRIEITTEYWLEQWDITIAYKTAT